MATPTVERQETAPPVWPEQGQWTFDDWPRLPSEVIQLLSRSKQP